MARPSRIKGPKEALVTDQPGRKVFVTGLIISIVLGFFLRGLINPQFVRSELQSAVSKIHPSTQISWSQAFISLKNGFLPRFSVIMSDVKIVSTESCWGQPLLYAREIELPFSFVGFFEQGQPLRRIVVRDAFLEFKSGFSCEIKNQTAKNQTTNTSSVTGPIRLKTPAENSSRPPLVLRSFYFENLKIRQPVSVFPDWKLQSLRLIIHENSPWYAELESDFNIPETEGVDARAQLEMVYKEFPSQRLEAEVRGHWREGAFRIKGQWAGPQAGWTFSSRFDHFPFQFLKTVAIKTGTPWNWPEKPMWFSFTSQTPQPFLDWKDSQHRVAGLKVEGDLGELSIPDLDIQSWQPFKVDPFVFAIQNVDISAGFSSAWQAPDYVQSWGLLSGQGQWIRESEFRFQGVLQNTEFLLTHHDRRLPYLIRHTKMSADLNRGQWKIALNDFDLPEGSGPALLKVEGPQNMRSGKLSWSADNLSLSPQLASFYQVLSTDAKWDWKVNYSWRDGEEQELIGSLTTSLFESRDLYLEKPLLTIRRKNPSSTDFQLVSQNASIREPFSFFPEELRTLEFPLKMGRTQFAWTDSNQGKWQMISSKGFSRGEIDSQGQLRGSMTLGGQSFLVEGTKAQPLLRLNR